MDVAASDREAKVYGNRLKHSLDVGGQEQWLGKWEGNGFGGFLCVLGY